MIEKVRVGDNILSYDLASGQSFIDKVILVNKHEKQHGICEIVRFDFDKETSLELEKHHFALVREDDGTFTEREASKIKADDHMLIFG